MSKSLTAGSKFKSSSSQAAIQTGRFMKILVLNAGSSSHKSCLYEIAGTLPQQPPHPLWEAQIDWTYQPGVAEIKVETAQGVQTALTQEAVVEAVLEQLVRDPMLIPI
jgi:acetate kinase